MERARGLWVHILHDDDIVMPGFYEAYREIIERNKDIVMVAGKGVHFDEKGRWQRIVGEDPNGSDLIEQFPSRVAETIRLLVSATVVRRSAYEAVGGWCPLFDFYTDWEMWSRLSTLGPVAGTPRPYLLYRRHSGSDYVERRLQTVSVREGYLVTIAGYERLHGTPLPSALLRQCRGRWAQTAMTLGRECYKRGLSRARLDFARCAWALRPSWKTAKFLAKSWIYRFLSRYQRAKQLPVTEDVQEARRDG